MRAVGEFKEEEMAIAFSAFLRLEGIPNEAEEDEGLWTIWVKDEESLHRAIRELERYSENPHRPEYLKAARKYEKISESKEASSRSRYRKIDLSQNWRTRSRPGSFTMGLIAINAVVFFLMSGQGGDSILKHLSISNYKTGLPEVLSGEIWRLVTPIFLHFTILHFIFNMMWVFELGGMIENRKGIGFLVTFVLLTAIISNIGQYVSSESYFGGMSGVVYACFGFAWMKGRLDPGDGIGVPSSTVFIMMGWFVLCIANVIPDIANAAHAVGLAMGMLWGSASAVKWRR
ncbi:MAG: rhomboid family intramembrane serine protease [Opitutales bacterium]|jgi:GlpG protein